MNPLLELVLKYRSNLEKKSRYIYSCLYFFSQKKYTKNIIPETYEEKYNWCEWTAHSSICLIHANFRPNIRLGQKNSNFEWISKIFLLQVMKYKDIARIVSCLVKQNLYFVGKTSKMTTKKRIINPFVDQPKVAGGWPLQLSPQKDGRGVWEGFSISARIFVDKFAPSLQEK